MNILYYNDIDNSRVKKQFNKTVNFLENGDFDSAEIKKLANKGYYRAKLDYENRLLFKFARYNKQTYILLLEVIYNHEYEKSRFLRGAKIDENKLVALKSEKQVPDDEIVELNFVNNKSNRFHLLNKVISFDTVQQNIFTINPPVVIIGSAGSGKTVLTLEKIKLLKGNVLYVTLSPFLVENSTKLYYSDNYINEKQDVDFLSFKEYLETLKVSPGKELDFKSFNTWLQPRKQAFGIKDGYKLFEEFRGVITGLDITKAYLSRTDYLGLGIKQSIFLDGEREKVYEAFIKYLEFLNENNFYDLNMISYRWLKYGRAKYDFIVIDEVQDFTNIQLYLILKSLKTQGNFILCGDSNQIVHPNFFSWTNVKTMFYKHDITGSEIKVLRTNYRNSIDITTIANKLLMIKNARFGSIDKESTFLVDPLDENKGNVSFYIDSAKTRKQL
nr:ATP-dependent helicase [Bacteroidota bacterium]